MSAGTAYSKRYAGGFANLPATTSAIDSTFLNAVEAALLQLIGAAPSADGQVAQWDNANTRFGPALLLNKNIDPAAAIAKSKLDLTGANGIVNADVASAAAIARSKLDFGSGLVNADIAAAAAIAITKLAPLFGAPATTLPGSPVDGQIAILTDSTTAPTYTWCFVYNAGSASTYKWQFIGGSKWSQEQTVADTTTSSSYADLTNNHSFTLPRAGDYNITLGGNFVDSSTSSNFVSLKRGASSTVDADAFFTHGGPMGDQGSRNYHVTGAAASDVYKTQWKTSGGTLSRGSAGSYMTVEPIRVI